MSKLKIINNMEIDVIELITQFDETITRVSNTSEDKEQLRTNMIRMFPYIIKKAYLTTELKK